MPVQDAADHVGHRLFHVRASHQHRKDRRNVALAFGARAGALGQLGNGAHRRGREGMKGRRLTTDQRDFPVSFGKACNGIEQ